MPSAAFCKSLFKFSVPGTPVIGVINWIIFITCPDYADNKTKTDARSARQAGHIFVKALIISISVVTSTFALVWLYYAIRNANAHKLHMPSPRPRYTRGLVGWGEYSGRYEQGREMKSKSMMRKCMGWMWQLFSWNTQKLDFRWLFFDPEGEGQRKYEERKRGWYVRWLPDWIRTSPHGSLEPNVLAEQGRSPQESLPQERSSHADSSQWSMSQGNLPQTSALQMKASQGDSEWMHSLAHSPPGSPSPSNSSPRSASPRGSPDRMPRPIGKWTRKRHPSSKANRMKSVDEDGDGTETNGPSASAGMENGDAAVTSGGSVTNGPSAAMENGDAMGGSVRHRGEAGDVGHGRGWGSEPNGGAREGGGAFGDVILVRRDELRKTV